MCIFGLGIWYTGLGHDSCLFIQRSEPFVIGNGPERGEDDGFGTKRDGRDANRGLNTAISPHTAFGFQNSPIHYAPQ